MQREIRWASHGHAARRAHAADRPQNAANAARCGPISTTDSPEERFFVQHEERDFLVTNTHVLDAAKSMAITFTARDGAGPTPRVGEQVVATVSTDIFVEHPHEDVDVAVAPVALLLDSFRDREPQPYIASLGTHFIPTLADLEEIEPIEDLLMLGYPEGIWDEIHNSPIARRALTATPIHRDYEGKPHFLIDAPVFVGSSGSPVLMYKPPLYPRKSSTGYWTVDRLHLLGVLSHKIDIEDGVLMRREVPVIKPAADGYAASSSHIHLGVVQKATLVVETINHLLQNHRSLL